MCHCGDQNQDWIVSGETKKSLNVKHRANLNNLIFAFFLPIMSLFFQIIGRISMHTIGQLQLNYN